MSAAEALDERDRILDEVTIAKQRAIAAGMDVLRRWAATARPFSANQCRAELRDVGVESASTGALFRAAIRAGVIRRVGWETSTDIGTHGKAVMTYVGGPAPRPGEAVTVPVVRNPRGRFTTSSSPATDVLFDVAEVTR